MVDLSARYEDFAMGTLTNGSAERRHFTSGRRPKPGLKARELIGAPMPFKRSGGMVTGMATRKLTITLEADQLDRIRTLVGSGEAPSVSGFVQHAVGVALDDVAGWGAMLAIALEATGGEISAEERRWADEALGNTSRRKSPAA
jgi:Arc/MetJ-type ribon-helix-helix transcriptional regulator